MDVYEKNEEYKIKTLIYLHVHLQSMLVDLKSISAAYKYTRLERFVKRPFCKSLRGKIMQTRRRPRRENEGVHEFFNRALIDAL